MTIINHQPSKQFVKKNANSKQTGCSLHVFFVTITHVMIEVMSIRENVILGKNETLKVWFVGNGQNTNLEQTRTAIT